MHSKNELPIKFWKIKVPEKDYAFLYFFSSHKNEHCGKAYAADTDVNN